ncbi:MAG: aminotransferase class I/II-fold pyridoxal phosphate-dependent enzyme [Euryarchaeota archaeon]|nr:aminotransferase class I/II-fold pyridoxal phosphate-dependent enzyme [Euryarchaeota archaeon]MDE1835118.1 aminotransferase class I/II-fold pyridoxal phosphate-dependent enzyme [Euryarchaeota archaeon]MDE1880696.1 aminotransferase class I/II-fold pyridoxal phosphate-dependent enzyme [Euryarchaeota archaeon]MDE2044919.1 aminotransferase class I/II-fold pyridoxal phosphate-dependent enzyme [Thermoplasmata archaeon]
MGQGETPSPARPPSTAKKAGDVEGPTWAFDTIAVHGAHEPDLNAGSVLPPIYQTSTYHYPAPFSEAREPGRVHLYTRVDNPNQEQAGEVIRRLEGAEAGRVFSSGMAALSAALLGLLKQGEEVVALEDLYGNTVTLLRDDFPRFGLKVRWVPSDRSSDVRSFLSPQTRLLLLESPTNPTLRVHDIGLWARVAHDAGALLLVDNTFASPVNQNPVALGADLVMHSATKSLGGHSDIIAGALAGRTSLLERMDGFAHTLGGSLDPLAAFLLVRGIKTLPLRVRRQNENGRAVVEGLQGHPKVERLHFPGSASDPEEKLCQRQMRGRTGMVSVVVRGGREGARRFMGALRLIHPASSLGGVESLASMPVETSHRQLSLEELHRRGIAEGMVRLSLGVEDPGDLLADLKRALDQV